MEAELKEENKKLTINSWEVEDAIRTIERAEEIKQNKELMDLVAQKAATKKRVLDDLANRANNLYPSMNEQ